MSTAFWRGFWQGAAWPLALILGLPLIVLAWVPGIGWLADRWGDWYLRTFESY